MPRTAFQKLVFGIMMAVMMVYGMEVYNASLRNGGLSNACFVLKAREVVVLGLVVLMLEGAIAGSLARRLALGVVDPGTAKPIVMILAVSVFKVCTMCPMMSLVAVILFKGVDGEIAAKWIQTAALNFPMALSWQLLVAGPLVRFLFRKVFAGRLQASAPA